MHKPRLLSAMATRLITLVLQSKGVADCKKAIVAGVLLAALLTPALAHAECTNIVDKHLEYYAGIKDHLDSNPAFDPGIKKIPYNVKIIYNRNQDYPLYTRNISFFYPNEVSESVDFGFESDTIQAVCIIETPDQQKWVVWNGATRLYFFNESDQPH